MDKLPFEKEEFDIIWSEGAVCNIGFRNGEYAEMDKPLWKNSVITKLLLKTHRDCKYSETG